LTPDIAGCTDSDWTGDRDNRKSIGAHILRLGDVSVSWKSMRQSSIALSSVEAEYMAILMYQVSKESVWTVGLLINLSIDRNNPIIIFRDNQESLALANNPVFHPRLVHIDIQYHFTKELVTLQHIEVKYPHTDAMIADVLTKSLTRPQHLILMAEMGVHDMNNTKLSRAVQETRGSVRDCAISS
jgi:hypothetical protein